MEKTCSRCELGLPSSLFYAQGRICLPCHSKQLLDTAERQRQKVRARNAEQKAQRAAARVAALPPPPYLPPAEKRCTKCREVKILDLFPGHHQSRDGRNSWCRVCCNVKSAEARRTLRATDPAWRAASAAQKRADRRAADPSLTARDALRADHREHVDAWAKWWSAAPERAIAAAAQAARDADHHNHVIAYRNRVYTGSPYQRAKTAYRRARRKGRLFPGVTIRSTLFFYERAAELEKLTGMEWHVDHIKALCNPTDPGWHRPDNLQVIPAFINMAKGALNLSPLGIESPP